MKFEGQKLPSYYETPEVKIIGYCAECGEEIIEGYEYLKTEDNEKLCDTKCLIKYFDIEEC